MVLTSLRQHHVLHVGLVLVNRNAADRLGEVSLFSVRKRVRIRRQTGKVVEPIRPGGGLDRIRWSHRADVNVCDWFPGVVSDSAVDRADGACQCPCFLTNRQRNNNRRHRNKPLKQLEHTNSLLALC